MFIEHILELMGNLLMWGCGNLLGSTGDFIFNVGFLMGDAFLLFFGMILCQITIKGAFPGSLFGK